jgi:N-acyl-phosphatidylethanolamine-hydrolysing phospholipase D
MANPWPEPRRGWREVLRWKLGRGGRAEAAFPEATAAALLVALPSAELHTMPQRGWRAIWLGHASFLLAGCGMRLLVDPVFADHCGPARWMGFKRRVAPPCRLEELPPVDAVLLTHGHYDHCDLSTLRRLGRGLPLLVPTGHARWLRRKGFTRLTELAWWDGIDRDGVRITAVPARHFNARTPWDRNRAHWCGWTVAGGGVTLWHSGDSGYMPAFREIGERLGPIDFGMVAIGAYSPRWFMAPLHMNPAEAVLAAREARCRRAVGMHWGTFMLSDEPLGEPPLLLARETAAAAMPPDWFTTGPVGGRWVIMPET